MSNPTAPSIYAVLPSTTVANRYVKNLETLLDYYLQCGGPERAAAEPQLRYAWSLARHRFLPQSAKLLAERAQVMVFGGAGTGKSTIVNALAGSNAAEVNAQAGYTRHPTALFAGDDPSAGASFPDVLGRLKRVDRLSPAIVDDDRFDYRRIDDVGVDPGFWRRHVVWDGPDLTTQHATRYETRVIEIAGLADVCVYVASDERYNDELPTNFLQAMLAAGKPVVVALTKSQASDADEFVHLFRTQVASKLQHAELLLDVVAVPAPVGSSAAELWKPTAPHAERLRQAIEKATADFDDLRRQSRARAAGFLRAVQQKVLDPLRQDLAEYRAWIELVRKAGNEAVLRFEREHLQPRSQAAAVDAEYLKVFSAPSPLAPVNRIVDYVREPYRFVRSFWSRRAARNDRPFDAGAELARVCRGIIESLRVQCAARKGRHRLWSELHAALDAASRESELEFAKLRSRHAEELEQRMVESGKAERDRLIANPLVTAGAQAIRLSIDLTALGLAGYWGGLHWFTLVWMLLAVGLVDEIARLAASAYGKRQREEMVRQQKDQVRESVRVAYLDVLARQPPQSGPWLIQLARVEEQLKADLDSLAGTATAGAAAP